MRGINWSTPALDDLRAINDWLIREAEPDHAIRILTSIRRRFRLLEDFPHGGRPHRNGVRVLRVYGAPYLVCYRIDGELVDILRVHHERENWLIES